MVFTELKFLWFFLVIFSLYWLIQSKNARKMLLLVGSYYFYGSWNWKFLFLILIDTIVSYFVARGLESAKDDKTRKWLISLNIIVCIGILFVFKYFNFFADNLVVLLSAMGIKASTISLSLILPVGISFFTFQTLSYSIDVYRREMPANKSLLDIALFIAFFPQLVAGPIVRAIDFIPQMAERKQWKFVRVRPAFTLILAGFFKKACVSDNIAPIVDQFFSNASEFGSVGTVLGVFLYATQIYCDFSGYSDMAIGLSELFGYRLLRNFNHPYLAYSITDFWRRWHISLSSWLRDYVYIPLGGNRGSELFCYRNLMLTMLIGGLWHGASWNFIIWGGLHGVALSIDKKFRSLISKTRVIGTFFAGKTGKIFTGLLTFYWVCLCWIFFRAADLPDAIAIAKEYLFIGSTDGGALPSKYWLYLFVILLLHIFSYSPFVRTRFRLLPDWAAAFILGLLTACCLAFMQVAYRPFIYFQF